MAAIARKSQAWLKEHRSRIGGSNAAAAVGLHAFKTQLQLFYEMVLGQAEDLETNPDALRGILLEPVARERLRTVIGMDIIEHGQDDFIRSTRYHWAHALPDGWIVWEGEKIPIEVKVPAPINWEKLDKEIPDYIQCQAVHNAAVIGAPALLLACLNPVTMEIYRQIYEPLPDAVDALMEAEERYWNDYIVPRIPPPPRSHDDLKLLWPEHVQGKRVMATENIVEAHAKLMPLKAEAKTITTCIDELNFTIKEFIKDNEVLIDSCGNVLATWKSHLDTRIDSAKLKEELPELWKEYAREKPVRTFLPKKRR